MRSIRTPKGADDYCTVVGNTRIRESERWQLNVSSRHYTSSDRTPKGARTTHSPPTDTCTPKRHGKRGHVKDTEADMLPVFPGAQCAFKDLMIH